LHIPDGFLDAKTWITTAAVGAGALSYSLKKVQETYNERMIPVMGVLAAFIFAAQMVNFPIAGGTSGHLLGATLVTVLLGPWCSGLIISTVLIIQCFFFNDGGLTALGANTLNMAFIGSLTAFVIYKTASSIGQSKNFEKAAIFLSAWASVVVVALAAALELAFSGIVPLNVAIASMLGLHALSGIGEGLITVVVISYVRGVGFSQSWQQKKTGEDEM